ncbi:hypothetical protein CWO91_32820 [Bradyrhizobium genosp. SA-3]|uniref:DUF805 domain-containing protein n=1 Tax=Bradyrhizobium genosp. SA-3 TaxID=508868 RepID=UPI0010294EF5|nr:DUF805 domain-containing protein [Bradyrhizobium genosp. SA-3]RZN01816.1 hypothetical protein CWO91_32820 [Bradyrhizobium genosp. SA-3]
MHSAFIWYFLSMKGRIGRQEFALGLFGLVLIDMLVVRMGRKLADSGPRHYNVNPPVDWSILHILLLVSLWPLAAILVKRLHDFNLSGWWALTIFAIPHIDRALGVPYWLPYLLVAATLSALPGWPGDNRFGPDPLPRIGI